jgi:hypothetical protein
LTKTSAGWSFASRYLAIVEAQNQTIDPASLDVKIQNIVDYTLIVESVAVKLEILWNVVDLTDMSTLLDRSPNSVDFLFGSLKDIQKALISKRTRLCNKIRNDLFNETLVVSLLHITPSKY